jgi:Protein of unknown function (DUF1553)/Protein of unknown function (DUF1549)/Planctomycete cytochrome C
MQAYSLKAIPFQLCKIFAVVTAVFSACSDRLSLADDEAVKFFETNIRPVLIEHCYECHSSETQKSQGELLLDSREAIRKGGASGPAVVPDDIDASLIIDALRYESLEMPPSGKLDDAIIANFEKWIRMGAVDPREAVAPTGLAKVDWTVAKEHWAFMPTKNIQPDEPKDFWANSPIDTFIQSKLAQADLQPNPPAAKQAWLRRVTFDLIGLPPTPEQIQSFVEDNGPDCYQRVVDRLLTSPRYGERYGRHWLDLARYADSNGADENHGYPVAWRYRDYVVDAMNSDIPYDRFIVEQMAGDLLDADSEAERGRLITATGFLVIGPKMLAEQDKPKLVADLVDEQIDTFGKVFLGLTLGCARCHDHKFDPIQAQDYYALAGVFHSTKSMRHLEFVSQWNERELPNATRSQQIVAHQHAIDEAEAELKPIELEVRQKHFDQQMAALQALLQWRSAGQEPTAEQLAALSQSEQQLARLRKFVTLADWRDAKSLEPLADELVALIPDKSKLNSPEMLQQGLLQAIREAWNQLIDVARNDQGAIKDRRLAKINGSLYGGRGPFEAIEKVEEVATDEAKKRLLPAMEKLAQLKKSAPQMDRAMAAEDGPVKLVAVHIRGNHLQQVGEPVQRRIPSILQADGAQVPFPETQSGRLELANWLTSPQQPLTARVMANRIWQYHFGEGLVRSASNFGLRGDVPSHPELLDYLANEFTRRGWSQKSLHREIVLTSVYGMSSDGNDRGRTVDPDNRLLWRMNRRRLEVEPLRDSLLAVADELDLQWGGQAQAIYGNQFDDTQEAKTLHDAARRTIYLPVNRAALEEFFATFDYVDSSVSLEKRPVTTVPHQALFMMNHRLAMHAGWRLAKRVEQHSSDDIEQLKLAYAICVARQPTEKEQLAALEFLAKARNAQPPAVVGDAKSTNSPAIEPWVRLCRSLLLTNEYMYVD